MRAKHYLKDKNLANLSENLGIHLLNGKRYNKITKKLMNDKEDPGLECRSTSAISL